MDRVRALVVVNPNAGRRTAKAEDLEPALEIIRAAGFALTIVETSPDGPTSADHARRAVAEEYDACVVAGGDGTVAPAAAELVGTEVVLGILPFGSFMNIARGLGIPVAPADAARVIAARHVVRADVGEVRGKLFFETAGVGLDAELFGAARHAERGDWRRALRRVARWATRESHRVRVTVDGASQLHRAMQVLVMNSGFYAWALPVTPEASMVDGKLDVAIFPQMGRRALLASLVSVWRGAPLAGTPVRYRGARVEISSEEAISVHADGAFAGGLPATFVCVAGGFAVYLPR